MLHVLCLACERLAATSKRLPNLITFHSRPSLVVFFSPPKQHYLEHLRGARHTSLMRRKKIAGTTSRLAMPPALPIQSQSIQGASRPRVPSLTSHNILCKPACLSNSSTRRLSCFENKQKKKEELAREGGREQV